MDATLTATCDRVLDQGAPEWVHLLPAGEMVGRDGRVEWTGPIARPDRAT